MSQTQTESLTAFDIQELLGALPHRYPFLLVDRIVQLEPGKTITGIKNVTMNEPFFQGHFPGEPVMPGVLILEAMAQVGSILACLSDQSMIGRLAYFAGVDKARFRRIVRPGDQLVLQLAMIKQKGKVIKMAGQVFVDEQLTTEAELMASFA